MSEPIKARALQLCREMSETKALMQLAAEGWLINASTIRKWRIDAGIPAHVRAIMGSGSEDLQRCVQVYRQHGEIKAAATQLGLSPRALSRRLKLAGEPTIKASSEREEAK